MNPTRLQYLLVTGAARALNPMLAMDAKGVDYRKLFDGVTSKNLKAKKPTIVADAKKLLKGKTIAKDADVSHLAHMLDQFEHVKEPKTLDESVSMPQHKAMEAAAHGHSTLGIPKDVGKEFSDADKGKTFDWDAWGMKHGISKDAMEELHKGMDEMPDNALDGEEETEIEVNEGEDGEIEQEEGEDAEIEQEEGEDAARDKAAKDKAAKDKAAKDKAARDKAAKDKGAMDTSKFVTVDAMNAAVKAAGAAVEKKFRDIEEAREFAMPFVGKLPMGLDSAEKVLRATANALGIEDANTVHASALKTLIKTVGSRRTEMAQDSRFEDLGNDDALGAADKDFDERWGDASRIQTVA